MRKLLGPAFGLLLLAFASTAAPAAQAPVAYFTAIEDLPLMPGLAEVEESGLVFDTPQGRIVEAYATGDLPRARVLAFYGETLPQLGWKKAETGVFRRDSEELSIDFPAEATSPGLTVRFALSPAQSDPN